MFDVESDYMEIGNGIVPLEGDWFLDKRTGKTFRFDEDGVRHDAEGSQLESEDYPRDIKE